MFDKKQYAEFKSLSKSSAFKDDMDIVSKNRCNPFMVEGKIDLDKFLEFLTEFNYFINHARRPFNKIKDSNMYF